MCSLMWNTNLASRSIGYTSLAIFAFSLMGMILLKMKAEERERERQRERDSERETERRVFWYTRTNSQLNKRTFTRMQKNNSDWNGQISRWGTKPANCQLQGSWSWFRRFAKELVKMVFLIGKTVHFALCCSVERVQVCPTPLCDAWINISLLCYLVHWNRSFPGEVPPINVSQKYVASTGLQNQQLFFHNCFSAVEQFGHIESQPVCDVADTPTGRVHASKSAL